MNDVWIFSLLRAAACSTSQAPLNNITVRAGMTHNSLWPFVLPLPNVLQHESRKQGYLFFRYPYQLISVSCVPSSALTDT